VGTVVGVDELADSVFADLKAEGELGAGYALFAHGGVEGKLGGYQGRDGDKVLVGTSGARRRDRFAAPHMRRKNGNQGIHSHLQGFSFIAATRESARNIRECHKEAVWVLWMEITWIGVSHGYHSSRSIPKSRIIDASSPGPISECLTVVLRLPR